MSADGLQAMMDHDRRSSESPVEFVLMVEAGILEAQTVLLCESLRRFGGAHADAPIAAVSPRADRRPLPATISRLLDLGVEYLPMDETSPCPKYATAIRLPATARVARRPGPPILVQLDSDSIFLDAPDLELGSASASARPVDVKGMCTTGPGDPNDDYWRRICDVCDVDYDGLASVVSTVDGVRVKAAYNGGFVATRRDAGLWERAEVNFRRIAAAGLHPRPAPIPGFDSGAGLVGGAGTLWWGAAQAAFSLAVAGAGGAVRVLPATHNVPLHMWDRFDMAPCPVHLHYHSLFTAGREETNPLLDGRVLLPPDRLAWLRERLPIRDPRVTG